MPKGVYVKKTVPPAVRVLRRAVRQPTGCLLFEHSINGSGYGYVGVGTGVERRKQAAHIVVYEATHGPVPDGLEIDHLCRVRTCVEISHLEAVTHRENDLRGQSPAILRHLSGICVRGHRFTPGKQCHACRMMIQKAAYKALRAEGYSADEARDLRNTALGRRLAGYDDLRPLAVV